MGLVVSHVRANSESFRHRRQPRYIKGLENREWTTLTPQKPGESDRDEWYEEHLQRVSGTRKWSLRHRAVPNEQLPQFLMEEIQRNDLGIGYIDVRVAWHCNPRPKMHEVLPLNVSPTESETRKTPETFENIVRRVLYYSRCSLRKSNQWFLNFKRVENHKNRLKLYRIYLETTNDLPNWFTDLFRDCKRTRTFLLKPTFAGKDDDLDEYLELSQSVFKISIRMVLSEKKSLKNRFRIKENLYIPKKTQQNSDGDLNKLWRQSYASELKIAEITKGRVKFEGQYVDKFTDLTKDFVLVLIQYSEFIGSNNIKGTYRRQMTSTNKFLTWKISIPD